MARINMFFPQFLERNGSGRPTLGGVETYIARLSALAADLGHTPVLYQQADNEFTLDSGPLLVRGIAPADSTIAQLHRIACAEDKDDNPVVVFCADQCSCPTRSSRSVTIQHGIHWDLPMCFLNLKGPRRMLWPLYRNYLHWVKRKTFERGRFRVCVDLNYINWHRTFSNRETLERTYYIPNCCAIFEKEKVSARLGKRPERIRILFARRLEEYRGTRIFTRAAERLLEEHPDIEIIVAGEGSGESYMRERLDGHRQVTFTRVPQSEMTRLLEDVDIAAVPSLGSEGTAFSLAEAMGAGCACIASNIGGMTNMVIDRHNGLVVWPTAESLHDAMKELITNRDLRTRLSWSAWETARHAFSEENWRNAWTDVFNAVISS